MTNISDLVALNKLSKVLGPFLILDANLFLVGDCHFKFNLEVTDPSSTDVLLKVSRFRTNWMDMDTEINYPMMNVVKRWYDDSVKLGPSDSKPVAREPAI